MLTLLTILLIVAMHRAYKRRMALKNKGKKEDADKHNEHNRTTLMLLAVVVLFLLTELPQGINAILLLYARCIATIRRIVNNVNIMHGIIFIKLACTKKFNDSLKSKAPPNRGFQW
jgi:uncharacterized membrane protein